MPIPTNLSPSAAAPRPSGTTARMHRQAQELEAAFLSEMLGHAGLGNAASAFAGGIGEQQFASFLRDEQARAIVAQGGTGLAETLFQAMTRAESHDR